MKLSRDLFVLFITIASPALAQALDFFEISDASFGSYSGRSYDVEDSTLSSDSSRYWYKSRYDFGDKTPSAFDTDSIRYLVAAYFYGVAGEADSVSREDISFLATTMRLRAEYKFASCPNFTFLRFDLEGFPQRVMYYVVHEPSLSLYPLIHDKLSAEDLFNRLTHEYPGEFQFDPMVLTLFQLRLKYQITPVFVLKSPDEVPLAAMGFRNAMHDEPSLLDLLFVESVNKMHIMKQAYDESVKAEYGEEIQDDIVALLNESSINIIPPRVIEKKDTTVIALTIYNPYVGEIAHWESTILSDGTIARLAYTGRPIISSAIGVRLSIRPREHLSPYFRGSRERSGLHPPRGDRRISLSDSSAASRVLFEMEHAVLSIDLCSFLESIRQDFHLRRNPDKEESVLVPFVTFLQSSLTNSEDTYIRTDTLAHPLWPELDLLLMRFLESGDLRVTDKTTGREIHWIRKYDYEAGGLDPYGATRFYLPSNKLIVDVMIWIS